MKKLFAFNLAEILITMSIIGVVAALVIPPLFGTFEDRINSVQMKKAYGEIDAVVQRFMLSSKSDDLNEALRHKALDTVNCGEDGLECLVNSNFFDIAFDCGDISVPTSTDDIRCFADSYTTINGGPITRKDTCNRVIALNNDVSLCIDLPENNDNFALRFEIDVNGSNLPNIVGKDLFTLFVSPNGDLYDPLYDIDGECSLTDYDEIKGSGLLGKLVSTGWHIDYSGCN